MWNPGNSFHVLFNPRVLCGHSFFKFFFCITHKGLRKGGNAHSLFLAVQVWLRAILSKYNPEQVRNNIANGNIICLSLVHTHGHACCCVLRNWISQTGTTQQGLIKHGGSPSTTGAHGMRAHNSNKTADHHVRHNTCNRERWLQLHVLANHSVCYIVHPLALLKHYIITLSVLWVDN